MELTIDQALQEGVAAHRAGKLQEAEKYYNAILKSQPDHPDANHNLGVLGVGVGKIELALPYFKKAVESNSKVEQYWVSYIDALIKLDQLDDAKQIFQQAQATGLKGEKLDQLGKRLGIPSLSISDNNQPGPEQAQAMLSLYNEGKFQEALVQGNALLKAFPNNPNTLNILGAIYAGLGNFEGSIEYYNRTIEIKPNHVDAHYNLGIALKELSRFEEAVSAYRRVIELKPDHPQAHNNLAGVFLKVDRMQDAIDSYNRAIEVKPDYFEAYNSLANALKYIGRYEEAIVNYCKAIELKKNYANAYNSLAHAFYNLDKFELSATNYKKSILLLPTYIESYNNLGVSLKELHKEEAAVVSYQRSIAINPNYAEALSNLGITQKGLHRYEEAISSLTRALDIDPNSAEAFNNLGSVLRETGRYKEAISYFDMLNSANSQSQSLECLYLDEDYTELFRRLNALNATDRKNIRAASVSAFVSHQLKRENPYPFCENPIDFFHIGKLKHYTDSMGDFVNAVIAEAEQINPIWEPRNRTTVSGYQTKSTIFEAGENCAQLKDIIEREINSYYHKFLSEDCTFIKSWPKKFLLKGWYVRLVENGYQDSHIHPDGWVSGVIYLKTTDPGKDNEGAIELSLHGYQLPILDNNFPRKVFQPQVGDIILFPSSLFHKTIPFKKVRTGS